MKIGDAKTMAYAKRKELMDQMHTLSDRKQEAEKKAQLTGDSAFSKEAATLELSLNAVQKAYEENQQTVESIMEQWVAVSNMESARQQGEVASKEIDNLGKIMTVFRRMAHGDIVPGSDEKKLMEYDDKLYQMAKQMQMLAQQMEKEIKKHKSLWDDEEKPDTQDPGEIADNTEFTGEMPDIEISWPEEANMEGNIPM